MINIMTNQNANNMQETEQNPCNDLNTLFESGRQTGQRMPEWKPPKDDDGTLSCLKIPPNPNREFFNCPETNQTMLKGMEFFVIDFHMKTTGNGNKYIVKIKFNLEDQEEDAKKFFTGSPEIKYMLDFLKKYGLLPRKVKMKGEGKNFWLE